MDYNYLGTTGSTIQQRIILAIPAIIGASFIISYFFDQKLFNLFFGIYILIVVYSLSLFSTVKYNASEIVIENIKGEIHYSKDDLLTVKQLGPYINLYLIVFKNNKSYFFGLESSRFLMITGGEKVVENMKKKLLSD